MAKPTSPCFIFLCQKISAELSSVTLVTCIIFVCCIFNIFCFGIGVLAVFNFSSTVGFHFGYLTQSWQVRTKCLNDKKKFATFLYCLQYKV